MRFVVESRVFDKLDDMCIGVVVARGVGCGGGLEDISKFLDAVIAEQEARLNGVNVKELPEVARYREAFRELGINPNKFMCSIEALFSRIAKQKGLPHINPIVDIANAVSLKHGFAIGAHDIDTFTADMEVRYARPGDSADGEAPAADEVVYVTGGDVRTRRWIWRQTESGKLSGDAGNILFPIDSFIPDKERLLSARSELAELLEKHLGCETEQGFIDKERTLIEI